MRAEFLKHVFLAASMSAQDSLHREKAETTFALNTMRLFSFRTDLSHPSRLLVLALNLDMAGIGSILQINHLGDYVAMKWKTDERSQLQMQCKSRSVQPPPGWPYDMLSDMWDGAPWSCAIFSPLPNSPFCLSRGNKAKQNKVKQNMAHESSWCLGAHTRETHPKKRHIMLAHLWMVRLWGWKGEQITQRQDFSPVVPR